MPLPLYRTVHQTEFNTFHKQPLATIARPPRGRRRADAIPEYIGRIGERAVKELEKDRARRLGMAALIFGGMYLTDDQTEEAIQRLPSMWASPRKVDTELTEGRVVPAFVLDWGNVPQRRVPPDRVIEQFDVLEHDSTRVVAGAVRRELSLAFQAGEERLHGGVVPALRHPAHAAHDPVL